MDTICAISTAPSAAAIGVIRVSGDDAFAICARAVTPKTGKLSDTPSSALRLCTVRDGETELDRPMFAIFRAPHSYTGENTVELYLHGGTALISRVLKLLIKSGCRQAARGEFTKRAFLNGKLDLVQAEAVCDLISSSSESAGALALSRMSGKLSDELDGIFDALVGLNTDICAYIDFPDEGLPDCDAEAVLCKLISVRSRLVALEKSYLVGSLIQDGADTAIIGAPNVGKSTLLNALLGYDRAIVSDRAGTTRDMVSERMNAGSIILNLCDTAGIHDSSDNIEMTGIGIARSSAESADLILAVFDGSRALTNDDRSIVGICRGKRSVAVINKSDLPQSIDMKYIENSFSHTVCISASEGDGIYCLKSTAENVLTEEGNTQNAVMLTSIRHYERVVKSLERVSSAIATLENGFTPDLAAVDITDAAAAIGEITGQSVSDTVIDSIFAKFCVGK